MDPDTFETGQNVKMKAVKYVFLQILNAKR